MTEELIPVPRRYLEQVAYAATAWSTYLAMLQATGQPLVPKGATVRVDGGPPQALGDVDIDLPLLLESVRETRRLLGWRK